MTDPNENLAEQIWSHVHGELDTDKARHLLSRADRDPELANRIAECKRLDLFMSSSLKVTPRTTEDLVGAFLVEEPYVPPGNKPLILFPSWTRAIQLSAACAAVLVVLCVIFPRGDLQWSRTEIALLDTTRSGTESPRPSALDRREIRAACARLQESIKEAHRETAGDDSLRWKLGVSITEFAGGSFELRVHGPARHDPERTVEVTIVYDNLEALNTDQKALAAQVVERMRNSAR
jgi:hypothetical protein